MDLGTTAQKWAVAIVGVFVLAVLASALLPLVTTEFASNGPLDNATSATHAYASFLAAVPTILIIVFIVALILGVIAMLKFGKHR